MDSNCRMNCVLRVDTQSPGWEKSLTRVIKRVKDVSYRIDATHGVVHISGEIDPTKLLTDIAKAGKHAELIHADCGGSVGHSQSQYSNNGNGNRHGYVNGYGYDYDGRYGKLESHPYPNNYYYDYEALPLPGLTCTQLSDPNTNYGLPVPALLPAAEPVRAHQLLAPTPTAPPLNFHPLSHYDNDPHNSSCNII